MAVLGESMGPAFLAVSALARRALIFVVALPVVGWLQWASVGCSGIALGALGCGLVPEEEGGE